jgi:hypothetical protein
MKTIEYIPGTDAGSLYRVIAKKGRVCLGVKPTVLAKGQVLLGWNVRAAVRAEEIGDTPSTVHEIVSAFPKVHFAKKDDIRASKAQFTSLGAVASISVKHHVACLEGILTDKNLMIGAVKTLLDQLDVDCSEYVSDKELADWVSETLLEGIDKLKAKLSPIDENKVKSAVNDAIAGIFKTKPE